MKRVFTIAITCIGSGIGQAIINSLRMSSMQIRTVGLGNSPFEYGALDCDLHDNVPSVYDPKYTDVLLEKCHKHSVDLIIPGLDDDVLILSENANKFHKSGIKLLASGKELVSLCRNKELICNDLNSISSNFVKCYNTNNIANEIENGNVTFPFIAKPRDGSGSTGTILIKNKEDLRLTPGEYVFQELLIPKEDDFYYEDYINGLSNNDLPQLSELSIQYVTGYNGKFIGRIATVNKLKNGVPIEIFPISSNKIWEAVDKVLPRLLELGLRGPLNIQGRLTDKGLRFFEVNPRFTGISALRASMGFNEVEECVKNWLEIPSAKPPFDGKTNKFGLRQVAEKVISIEGHEKGRQYHSYLNKANINEKKVLLITGSSGYLGRNFIDAIDKDNYEIWSLCTNKENTSAVLGKKVDKYFDKKDFQNGNLAWGSVDVLLHFGFARPHRTWKEIADSLAFTEDLFRYAGMNGIPAIINISSQSVYGQGSELPWTEETPVSPETPYATAKYSTELMLKSVKEINNQINITSLRLAGLAGGQKGLVPVDLVSKFVQQALQGEPLEIHGEHTFERLDVRDAVGGIIKLLSIPSSKWKEIYNLGRGDSFSIDKLVREVIQQVSKTKKSKPSQVIVKYIDKSLTFGMDSKAFYQVTNWKPKYSLPDTIQSLIEYFEEFG